VPRQVTCPRCGARLSLADDGDEQALTCPRCLARLEGGPAPARPRRRHALDREVRGDSRGTFGCLGVLIVLCVVGIVFLAVEWRWTGAAHGNIGLALLIAAAFCVLDVAIFILLTRPIWDQKLWADPAARVFQVLGLLALALGLGSATVVFFFSVCAVLVFGGKF
jgi:hypothetical protein